MRRKAIIAGLFLLSIALGALREFLFINLNYQLDHVARQTQVSYAHSQFQYWVSGWNGSGLTLLKWSFTVVFVGIMGVIATFLLRTLVGDHRYTRVMAAGVALVALLALALHLAASPMPPLAGAAVHLIHLLQYPALPMLVLLAWFAGRQGQPADR